MWDVSDKQPTIRTAVATGILKASASTLQAVRDGTVPKGDPLPVAKVAAVMAAKNTPQIIPFCHPLPVESVKVSFEMREEEIEVRTEVRTSAKTGVEMEALTAASVALLTLYDMLKQLDMGMTIECVALVSKTGGKSDYQR